MIIGMAGHVDHGKSALVTALSGRPMDRLAEERRRGITIDLNFAPLELAPGSVAGLIDVPGHEDFVRTMVAGASGVDMALLVVAANEGIMPQTREHLLVLEQLRVPAGIAVLTKADLVDPAWLDLVRDDVARWLSSSCVPFGAPVATSAVTGQGVNELRTRLGELARSCRARDEHDLFRLPVDRVLTVAGAGTVVTGTPISGAVAVGDMVLVLPSGRQARVRSIESHGQSLAHSTAGARTAVALSGANRDDVGRGDVLVLASDPWEVTMRADVELSLDASAPAALADRARLRVHLGTAEVMARVRLDTTLLPGQCAVARLMFESPMVARGHDRLVLRSYSPVMVIGGGMVLDPRPDSRRRARADWSSGSAVTRLDALVERRRLGLEYRLLPMLLGLSPSACAALVEQSATAVRVEDLVVRQAELQTLAARLVQEVEKFHRHEPHEAGLSAETLRHSLKVPDTVATAALGEAQRAGRLRVEAGVVAAPGFEVLPRATAADQQRLLLAVQQAGLTAPPVAELARQLGLPLAGPGLERAAMDLGLVRVEAGRFLSPESLEGFAGVVREAGAMGAVTPGALRDRTGLSRKFLIPLLEWSDRAGITCREGEARRLRVPRSGAPRGA